MNEFEQDPQSKENDIHGGIMGFTTSLLFFILIYVIGAVINVATS